MNYQQISDRLDHPYELSGISSGFREIDLYTEGFTRGDLVVLASRPSVGKTSLALALAYNAARQGTGADVLDTAAADALQKLPVLIDDTPGISVMELRTKARRAISHLTSPIGLIIVDYLQLMRTGEEEENRVQEIATITRNLKSLARELNVVLVALSQLSRAAGDAGHEPKLSTLRESGSIEQDSDQVIMLWRDKEEGIPGAPKLIKGSVAKNRNGPTGIFELLFEAEQARFFSRAREDDLPV